MHSVYYNEKGEKVPSVTTILKIINKPQLLYWAHSLGAKGMSMQSVLNNSAYFGTMVHNYLEVYFNKGIYIMTDEKMKGDNYRKAINNFKWFMKDKTFETYVTEYSKANEYYGGTLDFCGKINDKVYLIDFKTSKDAYDTHWLQLGGYYGLIKEEFTNIEGAGILIVNANRCTLKTVTLEQLKMLANAFESLAKFYNLYKSMGGEVDEE